VIHDANPMFVHSSDAAPDLETALGDPYDFGNPYGYDAIMAADERAEVFDDGELLLDDFGAHAEFVPRHLGGRLDGVDALIRRLRPVFRRDAALGLGYGVFSLLAALPVWLGGTEVQQRLVAAKMLSGTRVSLVPDEPVEDRRLASAGVTAAQRAGKLVVDGRSGLAVNAGRAETAVVVARTADVPREQSQSLLLVDLTALPALYWQRLPRIRTLGLRGCLVGGLAFSHCPVPRDAFVGEPGAGADLLRRSAQVGGCATMGLALGMLDASLFTVLSFAARRRLYGRTVAEIPHARAAIAGAFADLLALDCLVTTAARAVRLLPGTAGVYAAAAKHLVPVMLEEAMTGLSVVLGARFYLREGEHAIFGKHFRDLPALSILHPDRSADEFTMVRHLPVLARALRTPAEPPAAIFEPDAELPPFEPARPQLSGAHGDPLLAGLAPYLDELRREAADATDVAITADLLLAELDQLVGSAGEVPTWQLGPDADPDSGAHAERYATLVAASTCLGVWRRNRHRRVLTDTGWVRAALRRLLSRLVPGIPPSPVHLDEALFTELTARARERVGFCLDEDPVVRTLPA
jgi:alkylation response protein AidB-like acyl-CoA dehydrogenase